MFNTISEQDILRVVGPNVWLHRGQKLTEVQVKTLRGDVQAFQGSNLWKVLRSELLWQAQVGYKKSKGDADLVAVKVLELLVKTIDDKLTSMSVV